MIKILATESKQILRLALPITIAQFATMATGFIDTAMSGHASTLDMAGVAIAASIWFPILYAIIGLLIAITSFVSHFVGSQEYGNIRSYTQQGLWLALLIGLCIAFLIRHLHWLFVLIQLDETVATIATGYLHALSFGIPAIAIYLVLRSLTESYDSTKPQMIIALLALPFNAFANYILIFGNFGFPAMGGVGAGWATTITFWVMLILMVLYTNRTKIYQKINLYTQFEWPNPYLIVKILKLGLPISGTFFVDASLFFSFTLLLAKLGPIAIASHQIALNFSSLLYAIPLGLATASTIRVATALGASQPEQAKISSISGIGVTFVIAVVSAILIAIYANEIASIYSKDIIVIELAAQLLLFIALFQLCDGIATPGAGALRGYLDTKVTFLIGLFSGWLIALPLGYILALTNYINAPMGVQGFWVSVVTATSIAAGALLLRLHWMSKHGHIKCTTS